MYACINSGIVVLKVIINSLMIKTFPDPTFLISYHCIAPYYARLLKYHGGLMSKIVKWLLGVADECCLWSFYLCLSECRNTILVYCPHSSAFYSFA